MNLQPCAALLALSLSVPAVEHRSEASALRARCDVSLETQRAGRIAAPVLLGADDRAELQKAETGNADLLEMRAGELSDRDWTIIAIAAAVVLLIIVL